MHENVSTDLLWRLFGFKVNENFGIRGGALQKFDIRKGKWVIIPYFEFVKY
jgi:hypothetical protein